MPDTKQLKLAKALCDVAVQACRLKTATAAQRRRLLARAALHARQADRLRKALQRALEPVFRSMIKEVAANIEKGGTKAFCPTGPGGGDAYRDNAEKHAARKVKSYAKANGLTESEYVAKVEGVLQAVVDKASIRVRAPLSSVAAILKDGRLKSQHELKRGETRGKYNPKMRVDQEAELFGTPKDLPKDERPIYGYLAEGDDPEMSYPAKAYVDSYGDVVLHLKDDVRDRTSTTFDDSLQSHLAGTSPVVPHMLDNVGLTSHTLRDDPLRRWDEAADDFRPLKSVDEMLPSYVEAQIHGGVKTSDIESIEFLSQQPSETLIEALKASGIPWKAKSGTKAFCPTGPGGGVDNSCSSRRGGFASVSEAEQYIREQGWADEVSLSGLSVEEASGVVDGLAALEVGGHKLKLKSIRVTDAMSSHGSRHNADYSTDKREIRIDPSFAAIAAATTPESREQLLTEYKAEGGTRNYAREEASSPREAYELLVAHEVGHHVEAALYLDLPLAHRETGELYGDGKLNESEALKLSGYAATYGNQEMFAEAHALASTGRRDLLPPAVARWYDAALATSQGPVGRDIRKAFCPTGPGGGVDNSCSARGDSSASGIDITVEGDISKIVGKGMTPEMIAKACGATPGAKVEIIAGNYRSKSMSVHIEHPDYEASRIIRDGEMIENEYFETKQKGKGLGTEIFASQVKAAADAGFEEIMTLAAGEPGDDLNGYYTWARLGYDAPLPKGASSASAQVQWPEVERVSDMMKTPERRAWWKANGGSFIGTFDLKKNSQSRKVLDAYVAEKQRGATPGTKSGGRNDPGYDLGHVVGGRGKTADVKAFCPTGEGGGVDNSCSSRRVSEASAVALQTYSMSGFDYSYATMNSYLRSGKIFGSNEKSDKMEEAVAAIDAAISTSPVSKPTTLYRGTGFTEYGKSYSQIKPGDVLTDAAFTSTSSDETVVRDAYAYKHPVMRISLSTGQKALDMEPYAAIKGEKEWLIGRNSQFEVTAVSEDYIDVRLVEKSQKSTRAYGRKSVTNKILDADKWTKQIKAAAMPVIARGMAEAALSETTLTRKDIKATSASTWLQTHGGLPEGMVAEWPPWLIKEIKQAVEDTFDEPYWSAIVDETTRDDIEQVLKDSLEAGLSTPQTADLIREKLGGDYYRGRSKTIAITEAGNALNAGRKLGIEQLQQELGDEIPLRAVWLSILKDTTRDEHANLDGVPADEDGMWDMVGYRVPWPGHYSLPANLRVNCYCTIVSDFTMTPEYANGLIGEYNQRVLDWQNDEGEFAEDKAFCPTGPGGGVDNSCGGRGGNNYAVQYGGEGTQGERIDEVNRLSKTLFGKQLSTDTIGEIAGAPPGAKVRISALPNPAKDDDKPELITVDWATDDASGQRIFRKDAEGKTYCENASIQVGDKGKGTGTALFAAQVEALVKAGVDRIEASCAKSNYHNGYYTWARLGYDCKIEDLYRTQAIGEEFPDAASISDIISSPKGRTWWKQNGIEFEGKFDLKPGSKSLAVLRAYAAAKNKKALAAGEKAFCPTGPGGGIDNSCPPTGKKPGDYSGVDVMGLNFLIPSDQKQLDNIAILESLAEAGQWYEFFGHKLKLTGDDFKPGSPLEAVYLKLVEKSYAPPEDSTPSPTEPAALSSEGWEKTGGQLGTVPGGVYKGPDGKQYYVKFPPDQAAAHNEVLAAKLFAAAGGNTPKHHLLEIGGKLAVAREWVEADKANWDDPAARIAAKQDFALHAWLANWDAVGAGSEVPMDNIRIDKNGNAVSIDHGGALLHSGSGGKKTIGNDAAEWESMRDASINPTSAKVFEAMTKTQLQESAKKVQSLSNEQIKDFVDEHGGDAKLLKTLIDRKEAILTKAGLKGTPPVSTPATAPAIPPPKQLTTTTNPSAQKKLDSIYEAAKSGNIAAVEAIKTNGTSTQTYTKMAHQYKQEVLAAMKSGGTFNPDHHGTPQNAKPQVTKPVAPPKVDPSQFPSSPSFQSSKQEFVALNQAHVAKALEHATKGDLESLKAMATTPSPKLQQWHNELIGNLASQLTPPPPLKPLSGDYLKSVAGIGEGLTKAQQQALPHIGWYAVVGQLEGLPQNLPEGKFVPKGDPALWKAGKAAYDKMPQNVKEAIKNYTGSSYWSINNNLKEDGSSTTAIAANEAVVKHGVGIPPGTRLSRNYQPDGGTTKHLKSLKPGMIIQQSTLLSTTTNDRTAGASENNTVLDFVVGHDVKALPANEFSNYGGTHGEHEVIFPKNQRFLIVESDPVKKTLKAIALPNSALAN